MNTIPPGVFTAIIVGGFFLAAGILGIGELVKAIKSRALSDKRHKAYELSKRKEIRRLRKDQFRQEAEDMNETYESTIDYRIEQAMNRLRCEK